jgi:carbamoyltransferase
MFDGLFWVDGTQINSTGEGGQYEVESLVEKRLVALPRDKPLYMIDVAASAQKVFEDIVIDWVEKNAKGRDLAVAGGCFANVLANMKIARLVNRLFVCPPMFDAGLAVGAALSVFDPLPSYKVKDVYLGFSSQVRPENMHPPQVVAEALAEGKIVGLLQGRMEFGPRALGNRTILADARNPDMMENLNKKLSRTEFMPFAPVILEEFADEILIDYEHGKDCAPFMTNCWSVKDEWKARIPAVVHIDGTARPQVLSEKINPYYYSIVAEYYKLTGVPVLINTSFNPHEEPIVCFRNEAEWALRNRRIDILAEA